MISGVAEAKPADTGAVTYDVPSGGLSVNGRGFGNGIGLSQWGAYGAAKVDHRNTRQILNFYYPHTSTTTVSASQQVHVLLDSTSSGTGWAGVAAASGLTINSGGKTTTLPTTRRSRQITAWRLQASNGGLQLQDRTSSGWHNANQPTVGDAAQFSDPAGGLSVSSSDHPTARSFAGSLTVSLAGGVLDAVNDLALDRYLDGVVPSEMPASWSQPALRAQAIAARSYAVYQIDHPRSSRWDLYGDTRDQAYGGQTAEASSTDTAVSKTAGQVRVDRQGNAIFAAYGSADGGETVASDVAGQPVDYLVTQADPYDDLIPNNASSWTGTITRPALASAYSSIGAPQSVTVDARDGNGPWGGRITQVTVTGSNGSAQDTGRGFAAAVGLRGPWWVPELPPGAVRLARAWQPEGSTGTVRARWSAPRTVPGEAAPSSYRMDVSPGSASVTVTSRSATVSGLPAATAYAVTITPVSDDGDGQAVVVSSAVGRIAGRSPAVSLSRQRFVAHAAPAAVVVDPADPAAAAGAALAAAGGGPVLAGGHHGLGAATRHELRRAVRPGATVYLVGSSLPASAAGSVHRLGLRPVRLAGSSPAATAVAVADRIVSVERAAGVKVGGVVEADQRSGAKLFPAAAAAAETHSGLLLTVGKRLPASSQRWLSRHGGIARHRWAIGGAAAAADPGAIAIRGGSAAALSVAVARQLFGTPIAAAVVAPSDPLDGAAAAGELSGAGEPVLITAGSRPLPSSLRGWLAGGRGDLERVSLLGSSSDLPYSPVVTGVNAALLG